MRSYFFRFVLVGLLSTLLNYLTYIILIYINIPITFSAVIGYSFGLINSYILGERWVFKIKSKKFYSSKFKFLLLYTFGGMGMSIIVSILIKYNFDYKLAWLVGILFAVANNFLGSKYFVFKNI